MQTRTHTLKELKNTLNHTVSVPYLPPDTERHLAEWGWGLRVQRPPSWDKVAVWAQVVVEAVSFLPRGKVQRQG